MARHSLELNQAALRVGFTPPHIAQSPSHPNKLFSTVFP